MAENLMDYDGRPGVLEPETALVLSSFIIGGCLVIGFTDLSSLGHFFIPLIAPLFGTPQTPDNIRSEEGFIFLTTLLLVSACCSFGLILLRRRIGVIPFCIGASYLTTILFGAFGLWILGDKNPNLQIGGSACVIAASLMLIKLALRVKRILPPATAVAAIGGLLLCSTAVAFANARIAEIAGATALVCGVWYWILTTDFPALRQQIRSEVAARWRRGAGRQVIGGTALIIAAIVLYTYAATGRAARPQTVNEAQFFFLGWIALMVGIFSIGILGRGVLNLIKGLVPKPGSGIAAVERQKVHGNAGYAGRPQVDAALRDQDQGGYAAPHFRD